MERPPLGRPRTRVLVIDDEPLIASAARRLLGRVHEVEVAHSAPAALATLSATGFDAIVCDLMMPHMTGMELHARLAEMRPSLAQRMVFLTGGVFNDEAARFLQAHARWCMDKPFDPAALLALIADRIATARCDTLAPGTGMV
jgi:CheY-like chemotaxis protein